MVSRGEKVWLIKRLQADDLGSTRMNGPGVACSVEVVDDDL